MVLHRGARAPFLRIARRNHTTRIGRENHLLGTRRLLQRTPLPPLPHERLPLSQKRICRRGTTRLASNRRERRRTLGRNGTGLKARKRISINSTQYLLLLSKILLPLRPYWFEMPRRGMEIKRESGENPGQSRCCEFHHHAQAITQATGTDREGCLMQEQVRRPAIPTAFNSFRGKSLIEPQRLKSCDF